MSQARVKKNAMVWLNHWGIEENATFKISTILKILPHQKMWCEKYLEVKRKLGYYKEVINPNLEDKNYLFVLTSSKKKINIAKIGMNSHAP